MEPLVVRVSTRQAPLPPSLGLRPAFERRREPRADEAQGPSIRLGPLADRRAILRALNRLLPVMANGSMPLDRADRLLERIRAASDSPPPLSARRQRRGTSLPQPVGMRTALLVAFTSGWQVRRESDRRRCTTPAAQCCCTRWRWRRLPALVRLARPRPAQAEGRGVSRLPRRPHTHYHRRQRQNGQPHRRRRQDASSPSTAACSPASIATRT